MIDSLVIFINQIPSTTQMNFFFRRANSDLISGFLNVSLLILLFLSIKEHGDNQKSFRQNCLSADGKFTNGFVFILPIQTCTYN
jgi:hypothetical protein